ncbi:MAG: hypothetical protein V4609_16990 [Pseudomonadota bacterium]
MTHTVREKSAYMAAPTLGPTPSTQTADRPVVSSGARVKQEAFDHSATQHMSPPPTQPLREREVEQPHHYSFPSFPSSSSSSSSSLGAGHSSAPWRQDDLPLLERQGSPISPAALDRKSDAAPPQALPHAQPDLPRQERPARAWAVKREPRVKSEPAALTTAPPQPHESSSTTTTTAAVTTRSAGRQPKRKAEPLTAQSTGAPGPMARLDAKQTPSSARVAGPPAAPPTPPWQARIDQLLDEVTQDESQPVTLPANASAWRAWRESLQQVLPALEKALTQQRPASVDAPPTEAEARLLDLVYTLTELARQLPAPLPPAEAQAWQALVQDTVPRLARAAALPSALLADVPALRRALDGLACDGQSHHRAEALALRLGAATMRDEHRSLVVRHSIDRHLAADWPAQWVPPPLDAFARMAVRLAPAADGERFVAGCVQDGLRRALGEPLQLPTEPAARRAALQPLRSALSALGEALRGLPGLSPRQIAPVVQAILATALSGPLAGPGAVWRAIFANDLTDALGWSDAGCAYYAQALFAAVLEHARTGADLRPADLLGLAAASVALRGGSDQIAQARAALLRQVVDARRPNGHRLSTCAIAAFVYAQAFARETWTCSRTQLLRALAHLDLTGAAELLTAVSKTPHAFPAGFAQGIPTALARGAHGLSAPGVAGLALAWAIANHERGEPWLQAQFPASALGDANANLCRQASRVALRPSLIFAIPAFDTANRIALLRQLYRLPSLQRTHAVPEEVNYLLGLAWPASNRLPGRIARTQAMAELFEARAAQGVTTGTFLVAHITMLRDMDALLATAAAAQMHPFALDAARRFYQTLPACLATGPAGAVTHAPTCVDAANMLLLDELAFDLELARPALRDVALPVVNAERARRVALLPAPPPAEPQASTRSAEPL